MKKVNTFTVLVLLIHPCLSGDMPSTVDRLHSRHGMYVELGGPGFFTSLNYEYLFKQDIGMKAGFGVSPQKTVEQPVDVAPGESVPSWSTASPPQSWIQHLRFLLVHRFVVG